MFYKTVNYLLQVVLDLEDCCNMTVCDKVRPKVGCDLKDIPHYKQKLPFIYYCSHASRQRFVNLQAEKNITKYHGVQLMSFFSQYSSHGETEDHRVPFFPIEVRPR